MAHQERDRLPSAQDRAKALVSSCSLVSGPEELVLASTRVD